MLKKTEDQLVITHFMHASCLQTGEITIQVLHVLKEKLISQPPRMRYTDVMSCGEVIRPTCTSFVIGIMTHMYKLCVWDTVFVDVITDGRPPVQARAVHV
jgi:hypothetical protein